jgi:hypothetical protein
MPTQQGHCTEILQAYRSVSVSGGHTDRKLLSHLITMQLSRPQLAVRTAQRSAVAPRRLVVAAVARPSKTVQREAEDSAVVPLAALTAAVAPLLLGIDAAQATDGAYGILEGRTVAVGPSGLAWARRAA